MVQKRLKGVEFTNELRSIVECCLSMAHTTDGSGKTNKDKETVIITNDNNFEDNDPPPLCSSPASATSSLGFSTLPTKTNTTLQTTVASEAVASALKGLTFEEAKSIIIKFCDDNKISTGKSQKTTVTIHALPIYVIRAMRVIFCNKDNNKNDDNSVRLEKALSKTKLCFAATSISSAEVDEEGLTKEQRQHRKRMERLRLKREETKYYKLTSNITPITKADDDITTKSMTYAASIGLNMIIAPLSFGCFMYFFSGGIIHLFGTKVDDSSESNLTAAARTMAHNRINISKIIIAVISGVIMLFIEMLLFVIRTNELDKAISKKQKKSGGKSKVKPFGDYSSNMIKNFSSAETTQSNSNTTATFEKKTN